MGGQFVHEKQVALLHGQRNHSFLVWQMRFADAETLAPVYPVARVDVRDDMQAAVLKRRVGEGQPYGEDERRISLFKMDLGILVPGGHILAEKLFEFPFTTCFDSLVYDFVWQFGACVLDGATGDFRANETLDRVGL